MPGGLAARRKRLSTTRASRWRGNGFAVVLQENFKSLHDLSLRWRNTLVEKNVGGLDRILRLVLGPVLLVVSGAALLGLLVLNPILAGVGLVVGAVLTVTGLTQTCPANSLLGMNTFDRGERVEEESTAEQAPR
jgi:hypothetical protein